MCKRNPYDTWLVHIVGIILLIAVALIGSHFLTNTQVRNNCVRSNWGGNCS
jgi:uncharacterized membrane protein YecN with MAPEG domain